MSGLLVTRDGPFARVTLDRPRVRNAFNAELIANLAATFKDLAREPAADLRGIVLAGSGRVFCAGADIEWMRASIGLSVSDNERDAEAMRAMFAAIDECPVPVVARVQGAAFGGGMGLCAVSDVVVASSDAVFGFTETRLGILPAVISTFVLPKIGESHARALFTTGGSFGAERAMRIGLVHEIAADESALDAGVESVLADLLAAGPEATRAAKSLIRQMRSSAPDAAARLTVTAIARHRTSAEGQEGLAAFLGRRDPSWKG